MTPWGRLAAAAIFGILAAATVMPAIAVEPSEMLANPVLEARARDISKGLRCLVCQNQSIDDSEADLAHDIRVLVRERLKAGDTDDQVRAFIVARYGDFVLLKPPMKPITYLLWFGPALILGGGLWGVSVYFVRRRRARLERPPPLSEEERRRLQELLGGGGSA